MNLLKKIALAIVAVGILVAARVILVAALAGWHRRRSRGEPLTGYLPRVAVVVPAFNEIVGI